MADGDRQSRVQTFLNSAAAVDVRSAPAATVSPVPADVDTLGQSFESEVYRYSSTWMEKKVAALQTAKPFAFVLSRSLSQDQAHLEALGQTFELVDAFRSQMLLGVEEHLVIATVNLEAAVLIPCENATTSQALFNLIKKLKLNDRHIVAFEPSVTNLVLLKSGLSGASRSEKVLPTGSAKPWKLEELESEIERFHRDQTRLPEAILTPWKSAKKGETVEKLEIRISKALAHQLDLRWQRGSVLAEVTTSSGRMDIFVCREVLEQSLGPGVIEVKVLRDRPTLAEFSALWAKRGIIQAREYRDDKEANCAYLCSFDARKADADLPDVDTFATANKVVHKRYFMYRSTEALHDAELAAASA